MPILNPAYWTDHLRFQLERFDEPLLRRVAGKLFKPRNQWPAEELIDRAVATIANAAVVDRRLADLDLSCRQLLALIGRSRQPRWGLGNLVEMLVALGQPDGLAPIFALFEAGLLFPELRASSKLKSFEQWLGQGVDAGLMVCAHPQITDRALGEDLGLPDLSTPTTIRGSVHETDGLEWLLRLGVLWQQVVAAPLRRTLQGDFFKRDHDRLLNDPLLNGPAADALVEAPALAFLAVALAEGAGILQTADGELRAVGLPAEWEQGWLPSVELLWFALLQTRVWNALDGWRREPTPGHPFPSAYLLALLLLGRLPKDSWTTSEAVEEWVFAHHPYWTSEDMRPSKRRSWVDAFLRGPAFQLRLVQAAQDETGDWRIRLSPAGRWLLRYGEPPPPPPEFPQTLTVQPNLEIVAYRQGLTPRLIGHLSRFADWKTLGAACTLQLQPETVYRALEAGETFDTIRRTLEQHGTRTLPTAVVDSLRTWANKRERLTVYASATLFEFATADDLTEALARGLPAVRVSDRLCVVAGESDIDFRHFRLTGTRDYGLPPEQCVEIEPDGVTLIVDPTRSDLLVESELLRFADPSPNTSTNGRPHYELTPESLARARERGLGLRLLDEWFEQRSGQRLSPAGRLLLMASQAGPPELRQRMILHVDSETIAEGLMQWPGTRSLIEERIGPTALAVAEENLAVLKERLQILGISI